MKTVVTHNGNFHADEVFAAAVISMTFASDINFIRTRDEEAISKADIVVDVGGVYDEAGDRFDHHQATFKEKRKSGVPYASFGLVWKKYGLLLCGSEIVANDIDRELVEPIDAEDNGYDLCHVRPGKPHPFGVSGLIYAFNSTWKEDKGRSDEAFMRCVELCKELLGRMIVRSKDKHESDRFVEEAYQNAPDKRLIVLDHHYPAREVLAKYPEPLFVIRPSSVDHTWQLESIKDDVQGFKNRRDLPKKWGGKRGKELQQLTFVRDAIFCHRNLFIAVAESKEGAIALANKALETNN